MGEARSVEEIRLHLGSAASYFLIWFKLAVGSPEVGGYAVEISDIGLLG